MQKKAGVVERMRNLLRMNINAALDDAEDPTKALNLIVEDMRSEIHTAKKQVAEAIAQERLVKRQVEDAEKTAATWQDRAEAAIRAGDDELARESLTEKRKAQGQIDALTPQWEGLKTSNEELKQELLAMQERYTDVLQKKDVLIAKTKIAEARSTAASSAPTVFSDQSRVMLDRAEEKVRSMEAKAEAEREVAQVHSATTKALDELDRKGQELDIDNELSRLKKKMADNPEG
jgi:phage shock protein A